jgi:hypothetical protein
MIKEDRLLMSVENLAKNLDADWESDLKRIRVWNEVSFIYKEYERRTANIILSFAVYGYSLLSPWLEDSAKEDRYECLENIIRSLNNDELPENLEDVVYRRDPVANRLIDVILDRQPDTRFRDVMTARAYHARAHRMDFDTDDTKKFMEIGRCLHQASILLAEANKVMEQIRKDYLFLDTALEKQGLPKVTERPLTWEQNRREKLDKRKQRESQQQEEN